MRNNSPLWADVKDLDPKAKEAWERTGKLMATKKWVYSFTIEQVGPGVWQVKEEKSKK